MPIFSLAIRKSDVRTLSKSEYSSTREESSSPIVTRDFYVTHRTALSGQYRFDLTANSAYPRSTKSDLSFMKWIFFWRNAERISMRRTHAATVLWERTRTPRVNWRLFRAIRHEFPSQCTIGEVGERERKREKEKEKKREVNSMYSVVV